MFEYTNSTSRLMTRLKEFANESENNFGKVIWYLNILNKQHTLTS